MNYKHIFLFVFLASVLSSQTITGPGINVKDKKAIEAEVTQLMTKITQLQKYYQKYVNHRDNIREGFLHDSIFKLKGLAADQIETVFENIDDYQDYLDKLKESIFVSDPDKKDYWSEVLSQAEKLQNIFPEIKVFEEKTLTGSYEGGMDKLLLNRKEFLMQQLERVQTLTREMREIKKINEERIKRYKKMLDQLKEWSEATPGTWEGPFNQPMPKNKLLWVTIEIKKEIVTLKRNIFNILKLITDEELRRNIMFMEEKQYVF